MLLQALALKIKPPKTREKYEEYRKIVPSINQDRQFHKDIEAVAQYLKDDAYHRA